MLSPSSSKLAVSFDIQLHNHPILKNKLDVTVDPKEARISMSWRRWGSSPEWLRSERRATSAGCQRSITGLASTEKESRTDLGRTLNSSKVSRLEVNHVAREAEGGMGCQRNGSI
jgi:hypothetical protein